MYTLIFLFYIGLSLVLSYFETQTRYEPSPIYPYHDVRVEGSPWKKALIKGFSKPIIICLVILCLWTFVYFFGFAFNLMIDGIVWIFFNMP